MFVWELVEAEGSLRRGRGIKGWLNSFDRDSMERGEDRRGWASMVKLTIGEGRNILDVDVKVGSVQPLAEGVVSADAVRLVGLCVSCVIR